MIRDAITGWAVSGSFSVNVYRTNQRMLLWPRHSCIRFPFVDSPLPNPTVSSGRSTAAPLPLPARGEGKGAERLKSPLKSLRLTVGLRRRGATGPVALAHPWANRRFALPSGLAGAASAAGFPRSGSSETVNSKEIIAKKKTVVKRMFPPKGSIPLVQEWRLQPDYLPRLKAPLPSSGSRGFRRRPPEGSIPFVQEWRLQPETA